MQADSSVGEVCSKCRRDSYVTVDGVNYCAGCYVVERRHMRWPKPGDTWRWREPNGDSREMFVQRMQDGPGDKRAVGINPQTGRNLQCRAVTLAKGLRGAQLFSTVEGYVWSPTRGRR